MQILYAHHNDSYIKTFASTFSLVASLTSFCNALYLRAVLIRNGATRAISYYFYIYVIIHASCTSKKDVSDVSSIPKNIHYALNEVETTLIISLRKSTWLPIDEIFEILAVENKSISRSSVYRCLLRSPYKIVFTNIHFILYLCILPHTKFSYAEKIKPANKE